jgi:cold shock CspA family protein
MQGSVTKFDKKRLRGRILSEDDRDVLFDESSLNGMNTELLSVGELVEFQEQPSGKGLRAVKIRFTMCFTGGVLG